MMAEETSWSSSRDPSSHHRESSWSSSPSRKFLIESSSDESPFCSSEMMRLELVMTREDASASSGSSGGSSMSSSSGGSSMSSSSGGSSTSSSSGGSSKASSSGKSSSQTDAVPVPSSSGEDHMSSLNENEEFFQEILIHEDDVSTSSGETPMSVASSILSNESYRPGGVGGGNGGGGGGNNWNVAQMLSLARELLALFLMMAENLDKHHKRVNVARVAGGSVATVGGIVAIGAGIAIPFTFGVSIIIAIVGGSVAAAGGLAAGGAGIFKFIISKKKLKEAEQKWANFGNMYRNALKDQNFANQTGSGSASLATAAGSAGGAVFAAVAREAAIAAGGAGGRIAATAGRLAAAAASATVVINVVMLGFSLYDIIDGSLEIHRERKSPVGDIIRKMATELDKLIADLEGWQGHDNDQNEPASSDDSVEDISSDDGL